MKKEDFKFIYQDDGYYLLLYKDKPVTYIDYDNFDFIDDKMNEMEINNRILDIFINDINDYKYFYEGFENKFKE